MAPGSPAGWLRWERRRVRGAAWASEPMAEVEGSTSRPGTRTNLPARRRPRSLCFPPPHEPRARGAREPRVRPRGSHVPPRLALAASVLSVPSARRDHVPVLAAAASLRALPRGGRNDRWTHVCRLLPAQSREARLLRGPAPPPLPLFLRAGPAPAPLCLLLGLPTQLVLRQHRPPSAPGTPPHAGSGLGALDFPFPGVAFPWLCKAAPSRHPGQMSLARSSAFRPPVRRHRAHGPRGAFRITTKFCRDFIFGFYHAVLFCCIRAR